MKNFATCLTAAAALIAGAASHAQQLVDVPNALSTFGFGGLDPNTGGSSNIPGIGVQLAATGPVAFGGVGFRDGQLSFLPTLSEGDTIVITGQLDADPNTAANATDFVFSISEDADGLPFGALGENFAFNLPAADFADDGVASIVLDSSAAFFNGATTDGIINGLFGELQIQNPFPGPSGTVNLLVTDISFVPVPEPTSAALIGLGSLATLARRRKA